MHCVLFLTLWMQRESRIIRPKRRPSTIERGYQRETIDIIAIMAQATPEFRWRETKLVLASLDIIR